MAIPNFIREALHALLSFFEKLIGVLPFIKKEENVSYVYRLSYTYCTYELIKLIKKI
jgi:hypothetical protein